MHCSYKFVVELLFSSCMRLSAQEHALGAGMADVVANLGGVVSGWVLG